MLAIFSEKLAIFHKFHLVTLSANTHLFILLPQPTPRYLKTLEKMSGELDLMLQSLNSMRVEGLLTDVILVTSSGLEIPAHKNILAARSRYFYCMFNGGTYFNLLYFELDIHSVQGSNEPGFSRFGQTFSDR